MAVTTTNGLNPDSVRYFFSRGGQTRTLEIRLDPGATRFELLVGDGEDERVEQFQSLDDLITRERKILNEWDSDGWNLEIPPKNHVH